MIAASLISIIKNIRLLKNKDALKRREINEGKLMPILVNISYILELYSVKEIFDLTVTPSQNGCRFSK